MLMSHRRPESKLKVDQDGRNDHGATKCAHCAGFRVAKALPQSRCRERNDNEYSEKRLGEEGMENSDLVFQHRHAQSAENALQNNGAERAPAEIAHPTAGINSPDPDRENDGEKSDGRRDQPMSVLKENSADPSRNGKEKHVVAERRRPIGNGEANAFARDHAPAANQEERRD